MWTSFEKSKINSIVWTRIMDAWNGNWNIEKIRSNSKFFAIVLKCESLQSTDVMIKYWTFKFQNVWSKEICLKTLVHVPITQCGFKKRQKYIYWYSVMNNMKMRKKTERNAYCVMCPEFWYHSMLMDCTRNIVLCWNTSCM